MQRILVLGRGAAGKSTAARRLAEITGIPYTTIALAALIPAILYFICIFAAVHFEAKKAGMRGIPADEIPKALPLILKKGQLLLDIALQAADKLILIFSL